MSKHDDSPPTAGPPYFGMPEESPLTIEGRLERVGHTATHLTRVRNGLERPLRETSWMPGLLLIVGVAVVVVLGMVLLSTL